MLRITLLISLLISIAISQGCVSTHKISEHHLDSDRSSYYPLVVISSDKLPEVTSDSSYATSGVAGTGSRACYDLATSPDTLLIGTIACIPLMIFDVAAASVETVQDDMADVETRSKTEHLISRLKELL